MSLNKLIDKYAQLVAKGGINVQKGQVVFISCDIDAKDFCKLVVEKCYKLGAKEVIVAYNDYEVAKLKLQYESIEQLAKIRKFELDRLSEPVLKDNCCRIKILSEVVGVFESVDNKKIAARQSALSKLLKPVSKKVMNGDIQWTVVSFPNQDWAIKVFPNLKPATAYDKFLKLILKTVYIDEKTDPISNWKKHNKALSERCKKLNTLNFKSLIFKNKVGTNIEIGLVKNHIWSGGEEVCTFNGFKFNPNMPTEEVFTMPDNRYVNGKVCSTMPLLYNGKKINNFYLVFKNGKIVDFKAKENNGLLETLINSDKGTRSIGEVALVPYSSPISASKTLFYETLFDENASCHLAIGASYPMNIKDGAKMNDATLLKNGANVSNYHVDFMFGSSDMDIVGVKYNGQKVQVFKKGEFVLKL